MQTASMIGCDYLQLVSTYSDTNTRVIIESDYSWFKAWLTVSHMLSQLQHLVYSDSTFSQV